MYACERGLVNDDYRVIRNQVKSVALPRLKRAYVSFHHICGYPATSDTAPKPCSITVLKVEGGLNEHKATIDETETVIFTVPETRLLNNGPLSETTEWFHENIQLGSIEEGSRIILRASYDVDVGAAGFDNIHFHTPQK